MADARSSDARWRRASPSITVVVPALALALGGYLRRWAGDDGFINLRVVQQLMAGNGFVYNAGERCEAVTSALWILVLWGLGALGFDLASAAWVASLALSALGIALAAAASARLSAGDEHEGAVVLPFAALAYAAIPVAWDYATSALENGLGLAYLGGSYYLLARHLTAPGAGARAAPARRLPAITALVVGLGPLVRPDYALYAGPLLLVLLASTPGLGPRVALAALGALPGAAFQIFRMGYFASLVPNTAHAKEAFASHWKQGLHYLKNLLYPYWLGVPISAVLAVLVDRARDRGRGGSWRRVQLPLALGGAGAAHVLYVVAVGGDFMHGRLLLPGLFAIFASVGALRVRPARGERRRDLAALAVMAGWSVVCATWLRPWPGKHGISDERAGYVRDAADPHPTHVSHYAAHPFFAGPRSVRERLAARCPRGLASLADGATDACPRVALPDPMDGALVDHADGDLLPLREGVAAPGVVAVYGFRPLGLSGQAVGLRVSVVDSFGLADPLAARLALHARSRPGHEKVRSTAWFAAKYAAAEATADPEVALARRALRCGRVAELERAIHEPLTMPRFVANLRAAFTLHDLRIPADPAHAVEQLCEPLR